MNEINETKLETLIQDVLLDLDHGLLPDEISQKYPTDRLLVEEVLGTIQATRTATETIKPPQHLLEQTIAQIAQASAHVTDTADTRYTVEGEVVSPYSSINSKINIYNRMTINWKILVPVGIVAVMALVLITDNKIGNKISQDSDTALTQVVTTPATGNLDDVVVAVLASANDDEALYADAAKDSELISADSQAISNFSQSYNENEL
jgi:hypothetical protein